MDFFFICLLLVYAGSSQLQSSFTCYLFALGGYFAVYPHPHVPQRIFCPPKIESNCSNSLILVISLFFHSEAITSVHPVWVLAVLKASLLNNGKGEKEELCLKKIATAIAWIWQIKTQVRWLLKENPTLLRLIKASQFNHIYNETKMG